MDDEPADEAVRPSTSSLVDDERPMTKPLVDDCKREREMTAATVEWPAAVER